VLGCMVALTGPAIPPVFQAMNHTDETDLMQVHRAYKLRAYATRPQ
jgi:hypothetical protein